VIGDGGYSSGETALDAARQVVSVVSRTLEPLFEQLDRISQAAVDLAERAPGQLATAALATLDEVTQHSLLHALPLLHGAGFVADVDLLSDAPRGIRWWVTGPDGTVARGRHLVDLTRPDHYEYVDLGWFTGPKAGEPRCVFGPYVDYGGTNDYSITISVPARLGSGFLGVAAADLALERVEQVVGPALQRVPGTAVIANAEGQVVLSASPEYVAGSFLPALDERARVPCPAIPWSVCVTS
jgi:hypothetical protein